MITNTEFYRYRNHLIAHYQKWLLDNYDKMTPDYRRGARDALKYFDKNLRIE